MEGLDALNLYSPPLPAPIGALSALVNGPLGAPPDVASSVAMPAVGASVGHSGGSRLLAVPTVFPGGMNGSISGADSVTGFDGDESLDSSPKGVSNPFGARASSTGPHSLRATPCGHLGLTEVVPNLYLGPYRAVRQVLASPTAATRLDALVCVAKGLPRPLSGIDAVSDAPPLLQSARPAAERCHHFELLDDASQAIVPAAQQVCAIIDKCLLQDQSIAVYCQAGKSRSVSCVLFWLMTRRNMSFDAAMAFLRRVHPSAEPNIHFIEQLRQHAAQVTAT
jgi:hypothetical protein